MKNIQIIKNILSLSGGQLINIILNLITIGIITRYLTLWEFGLFNYWLALIGVLSKFVDLGLGPIVLRECSKNRDCYSYLSTSIIFRIILLFILAICVNGYLFFAEVPKTEIYLANFLILNIIFSQKFNNVRDLLNIPFKRRIKMQIPILINVLENLLLLLSIILVSLFDLGFVLFLLFYVVSNIPGFFILLLVNIKNRDVKLYFSLNRLKYLIRESLPLAGYVLFAYVYLQVDLFLIKVLLNEESVGLYSAAVRLSRPLLIIPSSLITTFFPLIVYSIKKARNIDFEINLVVKILVILGLAISLLVTFKTADINSFVFGSDYSKVSVTTALLFWTLSFTFFNFFILDVFTAKNKQKYNLYYIISVTVLTIIADIIFISLFGLKGAAIARIFSAFIGTLILLNFLKKIDLKINYFNLKILTWTILSFILVYFISSWSFMIYLPVSSLVLLILIILLRVFNSEEIIFLKKHLKFG